MTSAVGFSSDSRNDSLATVALWLGLGSCLGIFLPPLGFLTSLVGLTIGLTALFRARWTPISNKKAARIGVLTSGAALLLTTAIMAPCVLGSRKAANEAGAISTLRTINGAQAEYLKSHNSQYGTLVQLSQAKLIDSALAGGVKNGYRFEVRLINDPGHLPSGYEAQATPLHSNGLSATGSRSFYTNATGVLRFSLANVPVTANSTVLDY